MKKSMMVMMLVVLIALAACSNGEVSSEPQEAIEGVPEAIQGDIKVAILRNLPSDDHTTQFLDGARKEGEAFGFTVETFISNGDDARFQDLIAQVIQQDYDGLIISHGKRDYSYDAIKPALDKGIEVVTFDTVAEKDGEVLSDVVFTAQNDHKLAELSLDEVSMLGTEGEPTKVIKLWFGGLPPLDMRDEIYQMYEESGRIETLETIGPTNMENVQDDIASKVGAILAKYPEGEVDAIWASWDELAKGAYNALKENNRMDINIISIDISNQDINFMTEGGSNWLSTAAVDPGLIGVMNMRLLAKKMAGESVPNNYQLEPNLITQEYLTPDTTMDTLSDVIEGWGHSDDFDEDWMRTLREAHAE